MSDFFKTLPTTKEKVTSVITKLKTQLGRNPTVDEIAADLNITTKELQRFINPTSSESRYYGSSLEHYNRPPGSIFDDLRRYERYDNADFSSHTLLDEEKMKILNDLNAGKIKPTSSAATPLDNLYMKLGGRRKNRTTSSNKKKYKKTLQPRKYRKKYKKSMKRK